MLRITVSGGEFFNEETQEFIDTPEVVLDLEHSLVSLSKWESIHQKPFLNPGDKSIEEIHSYIEAMILTPDYPSDIISRLDSSNLETINDYISSTQSATTFVDVDNNPRLRRSEVITSELIYFWMVTFNVPFECETWHLNRLFSLLRICNIKNSKEQKMSRSEIHARNRKLNAERRQRLGTRG